MPKVVRIIALIMAILLGLSAVGMIAMYVAAEGYEAVGSSAALISGIKNTDFLNGLFTSTVFQLI